VSAPLATGLGTPIANTLVPHLAAYGVGVVYGNWIGTGGGSWSTTSNWDSNGVPGITNQDTAAFGTVIGSNSAAITLDGSRLLSSLTFNTTGGGSYTLSRSSSDNTSTLTLGSTSTTATLVNSGGSHTISVPLVLAGNLNVSAASGTAIAVNGSVSETGGSQSVNLSGGGTLVLAASNSYNGGTAINGGTLGLAHRLAVQYSTVNISSSGALSFAAGNTTPILGGLAGAGNIALTSVASEPVSLNVGNNNQNTTYSGSLSGSGSLTKQGNGMLTLSGTHGYNGATLVSSGTLQLQAQSPTNPVTTNLNLWLDATKLSLTNGASVSTWNDLSGNNRNATAGTSPTFSASNSAFNNLPTVHFNGSNQYLNVNLTFLANSPYTIFAVTAKNSSNTPAYFLGNSTGSGQHNITLQCGWVGNTTLQLAQYSNDLHLDNVPTYTGAEVGCLYQAKFDQTGSVGAAGHYLSYSDSSATFSSSNGNTTPLGSSNSGTIGQAYLFNNNNGYHNNWFNGDIGEILVYNAALTDSQRQSVDAYLNAKWGLGISGLPSFSSSNLLPVATPLTIAASAMLDLNGVSQQVASLSGSGLLVNSSTSSAAVFKVGDTGSTTFFGTLSDTGGTANLSLIKVGTGTLTLVGSSTYSGSTTLSNGVLSAANGSLGSATGTGAVLLGGGSVLGSGSLGTIGGSVQPLAGSGSGAYSIAPGLVGSVGTLAIGGGLILNSNATLDFDWLGTRHDTISLTGTANLTFSGTGTATILVPSNMHGGTYELIGASGGTLASDTCFTLQSSDSGTLTGYSLALQTNGIYLTVPGWSGTGTWTSTNSNGTTLLWSGSANWTDGGGFHGIPGITDSPTAHDMATFSNSSSTSSPISLEGVNPNLKALSFSGSYTLTGGSLTLDNSAGTATVTVSSGTQTIESATTLTLASTTEMATAASSALKIKANIGEINGRQLLLKDGSGTLVLSGTNNYSGGTVVNAGTLIATSSTALPDGGSLTVGAGGTLIFDPTYGASPIQGMSSLAASPVPEPGTLALLLAGLVGLGAWRKRRIAN